MLRLMRVNVISRFNKNPFYCSCSDSIIAAHTAIDKHSLSSHRWMQRIRFIHSCRCKSYDGHEYCGCQQHFNRIHNVDYGNYNCIVMYYYWTEHVYFIMLYNIVCFLNFQMKNWSMLNIIVLIHMCATYAVMPIFRSRNVQNYNRTRRYWAEFSNNRLCWNFKWCICLHSERITIHSSRSEFLLFKLIEGIRVRTMCAWSGLSESTWKIIHYSKRIAWFPKRTSKFINIVITHRVTAIFGCECGDNSNGRGKKKCANGNNFAHISASTCWLTRTHCPTHWLGCSSCKLSIQIYRNIE